MPFLILFELIGLFITSRFVSQALFSLFFGLTKREGIAFRLLALVFFPGTLIHELSHFLMAKLLFVRTGKMSLIPQMHGKGIRLGSVEVAKTDIARSLIIGAAPLVFGSAILISVLYYFSQWFNISHFFSSKESILAGIGAIYIIFVIANTMFSSKKDMEGGVAVALLLATLLAILIMAGKGAFLIDVLHSVLSQKDAQVFINKISQLLVIPLVLNGFLLILVKVVRRS